MVIGGREITYIPSEYFNPSHLGARNDVFSPDQNLTQLETPLEGRITQRQTEVTRSNTGVTNRFLLSLVPAGFGPILRSGPCSLRICRLQVSTSKPTSTFFGHCWSRASTAKHASTTWIASSRLHQSVQAHNSTPHEKGKTSSSRELHLLLGSKLVTTESMSESP
ncbi:hypothetical protein YC2023_071542 [Brassica napus]